MTKRLTIALALLGAIALASCKPEPKKQQPLDPAAQLYINVTQDAMKVTQTTDTDQEQDDPIPTAREVVEQALDFYFTDPRTGKLSNIGIAPEQLDVENERIVMWGNMIISDQFPDTQPGEFRLNDYFLKLRDVRVRGTMKEGDTEQPVLAYIPNSVMEAAEESITREYNAGNYDEVYRQFQELYTAIPTTTKRWEALKAEGKQ